MLIKHNIICSKRRMSRFVESYIEFRKKHNMYGTMYDDPMTSMRLKVWETFGPNPNGDIVLFWNRVEITLTVNRWYEFDIACIVDEDIDIIIDDDEMFDDDSLKREFVYLIDAYLKKNNILKYNVTA